MTGRAAGAHRARRFGGWCVVVALWAVGAMPMSPAVAAGAPDWVANGGGSTRHPAKTWVTGYGQARGRDAEARARQAAMAALAQAIEVRVEVELQDDRSGGEDRYDERIAALTRTSSEIELRDVRFETWRGDRRVHVLAAVERATAGRWRRAQRDRALVRAEACLADAELAREVGEHERAERRLADCRTAHSLALRHDTVSTALDGGRAEAAPVALDRLGAELDRAERATETAPPRSLAEAADRIAEQLVGQGLRRPRRLDVTPLVDAGTDLPSPFGQAAALEIERALAAAWSDGAPMRRDPRRIELGGAHRETAEGVRLTVVAREFGTGTLTASGAAALPQEALPEGLALRPPNWKPALERRDSLARQPGASGAPAHAANSSARAPTAATSLQGDSSSARPAPAPEPASSPLRIELWTDRGRERVSYTEGESIHVFMRVSGPAWVRLVYVLSNGLTVPIEDALQVDAERAQTAIALPERLEVVPPFGVEMLHAAAYRDRPAPLATRRVQLAGQAYDVVDDGVDALVRSRGVRVQLGEQVAEDVLTVTTLAASTGSEWRTRDRD